MDGMHLCIVKMFDVLPVIVDLYIFFLLKK